MKISELDVIRVYHEMVEKRRRGPAPRMIVGNGLRRKEESDRELRLRHDDWHKMVNGFISYIETMAPFVRGRNGRAS